MNDDISRRGFAKLVGTGAAVAAMPWALTRAAEAGRLEAKTKPILGSWISILRSECRHHHYWNDVCAKFSREQWESLVKEAADIGMQYLVLLGTVDVGQKAFFDTPLAPKAKDLACENPIEAMLSAADQCGVKFFISTGFYGGWLNDKTMADATIAKVRFTLMAQLAEKYAHHRSFYGWYLPDETGLNPYFSNEFIEWVNRCGREGRRLTPGSKILIAPYGANIAVGDDKYAKQLERLDADIIAYQDEVGQRRMTAQQSARAFEKLRRAHDKVPQRALWADVEVFDWDGPLNSPDGALIPAPFARIKQQLEAVSPFVDVITIYQYQGLLSRPGGKAHCGHPGAAKLYVDYVNWLKSEYPELVK